MSRVAVVLALAVCALTPATADAAGLAVTAPAASPSEDSGFPIVVAGSAEGFRDADAYLTAKIRPAGAPCAPSPDDDSGDRIDGLRSVLVKSAFSLSGSQVLSTAGTYVVCAWLEEDCCLSPAMRFGPVSATVVVRPPQLMIAMAAPAAVAVGTPFEVAVSYFAEVPRFLSVIVARAASCSISGAALKGISSRYQAVADEQQVSGGATIRGAVRFDEPGTYLVCGFFERTSTGAAQYAAVGPAVVVSAPARFRSCGAAGGRRHITNVRAKNVSCGAAKALARRWGRTPRKRLGVFSCVARARVASCISAGGGRVTFHTGRR